MELLVGERQDTNVINKYEDNSGVLGTMNKGTREDSRAGFPHPVLLLFPTSTAQTTQVFHVCAYSQDFKPASTIRNIQQDRET